ncbi:MAG: hypothetical protein AAB217_18410 [Chloroflexota bacterium]
MKLRRLIFIAALTFGLIIVACGGQRVSPTVTIPAPAASFTPAEAPKVPGQVAAVDLIGAWVNAGASETESFEFIGLDGQTYVATFADDIFPLFDRPNRWFDGAKECSNCHVSDLADSDAELDLSSYEGILAGSYRLSNPPGTPIIVPGDWQASLLRNRLMWNRMPIGVDSEAERDGPEVEAGGGKVLAVNLIGAWVAAGAPGPTEPFQFTGLDGNVYVTTYGESIEPLFTQSDVWYTGTKSCQRCHVAKVSESDAELDMSSIEGILAGSYRLSQPPGTPIIVPGDWQGSLLRKRLRDNRMPSGITDDVPPEGPIVEAGYLK